MAEILVGIFILVFVAWSVWAVLTIVYFFDTVPKHLKRIADALERKDNERKAD